MCIIQSKSKCINSFIIYNNIINNYKSLIFQHSQIMFITIIIFIYKQQIKRNEQDHDFCLDDFVVLSLFTLFTILQSAF